MLGKTLGGRYQITRHLGGGGFGQTFLAEDLHLPGKPQCVVKQLQPRMTNPEALQTARRMFDTEAQTLYMLGNHQQIPRLFAHFEENPDFFLVQEFIEGTVLSQELKERQQLPEAEVIELLLDLLSVLEFVHQQQVIHRDIKPSNLIRRTSDRGLFLIDFGAVKQIGLDAYETPDQVSVTVAVGSSGYMPNEQLAGKPRFSSDIYAVGILAIQCLTGLNPRHLPEDPKTSEILWRDRAQVSPEFAEILDIMVRYDFRQRYPSAKEALEALRELTHVVPVPMLLSEAKPVSFDGHLAWFERGDELFHLQRYKESITAYDRVIQAKPTDYLAWFKRGIALENLHRYEDAAASYDRVVQLNPEDYLAWYKRGNALEQLQQYEQALAAFEQVVQLQPENYWAWHDRGRMLERLQQNDMAIASYDRAVQLKPDFQLAIEGRKRVLSQLRRVDVLYHLQHYDEAIASCDRAIQQNPNDSLAWFMRGMAMENLQSYEEAATAYSRVVEIQPDDHVAWFKWATVQEKLNQDEAAIESYLKVVQLQPDNYWAWHDRGRLLEKLQQHEEAIICYDRAVQIKPDFQVAVEGRRRMLRQLHQLAAPLAPLPEDEDETIASVMTQDNRAATPLDTQALRAILNDYKQRVQLPRKRVTTAEPVTTVCNPVRSPQTLQPALSIVEETGIHSTQEGNENGETQVSILPKLDRYRQLLRKGQALEKVHLYAEALVAYDRASQLKADEVEVWRGRGNVLYALKRYPEAIAAYEQATHLQPENVDLWYCLGVAFSQNQQPNRAIACFDTAIHLKPENAHPWYWRGRMLCELKQYAEAIRCFDCALERKPDFQPAQNDRRWAQNQLRSHEVSNVTTV